MQQGGYIMKRVFLTFIVLLSCAMLVSGCSFSKSSKHSSKSSSSPSRSSSKTTQDSAQQAEASMTEEVATLTSLYVKTSGSAIEFQREIGEIAKGHGTVDWENNPHIFSAIGTGVKRAGVAQEDVQALPFLQGLEASPYFPRIMNAYK